MSTSVPLSAAVTPDQLVSVAKKVEALQAAVFSANPDVKQCLSNYSLLKLDLLGFDAPASPASEAGIKQLTVARKALELGVIISVQAEDMDSFQRSVAQLYPYYFDYGKFLPPSEHQWSILGLNLMFLLVRQQLIDFHTQLELIPHAVRDSNAFVQFPVALEQGLMEGSYNGVLAASRDMPSPFYKPFMNILTDTVRQKISRCAAAAYESMLLSSASRMLLFKSNDETANYCLKQGWRVEGDSVWFPRDVNTGVEVAQLRKSHHEIIKQNLNYATELERIV